MAVKIRKESKDIQKFIVQLYQLIKEKSSKLDGEEKENEVLRERVNGVQNQLDTNKAVLNRYRDDL